MNKICFFLVLFCAGCFHTYTYKESDFNNTKWIADDGSTINFFDNDSCLITGFDWVKALPNDRKDSAWFENHPQTFEGKWSFYTPDLPECSQYIYIYPNGTTYGFQIFTSIFYNDVLHYFINDPDDFNAYTFRKITD